MPPTPPESTPESSPGSPRDHTPHHTPDPAPDRALDHHPFSAAADPAGPDERPDPLGPAEVLEMVLADLLSAAAGLDPLTAPHTGWGGGGAAEAGRSGPGEGQQAMFPPVPARLWPEPGARFLVKTHHTARVWHPPYNEGQVRARINEQIEGLQWRPPRPGQPFDPASTVTELLRRLPTHQVTAAAADGRLELPDGPETTVYGLYGLEALFRGVPLRLYIPRRRLRRIPARHRHTDPSPAHDVRARARA